MFKRASRKCYLVGLIGFFGIFGSLIVFSATGHLGTKDGDQLATTCATISGLAFIVFIILGYILSIREKDQREIRNDGYARVTSESDARRPVASSEVDMVEETVTRITVRTAEGGTKSYKLASSRPADLQKAIAKLKAKGCKVVNIESAE